MKVWIKSMTALALLAGLACAAQQARAGCGAPDGAAMRPAVFRGDAAGTFLRTGYALQDAAFTPAGSRFGAAITGLWKFTFVSDGTHSDGPPPNALVDAGFVTWHADGTEIMNSGRAPASGSFCMGVWEQTGPRAYKLNHWALSWIPAYIPGATQSWSEVGGPDSAFQPAGPTNIQETITLSADGNTYTGKFTITNYHYDGKNITDADPAAGTPQIISGTVTATRINP